MEIIKDIEIIDLSLFLKKHNTLILSDLHIGYEESLNDKGVLVPRVQFKQMYTRLKTILEENKFREVIITGDLKHEFGIINDTEWKNTLRLIDLILEHCEKLILIKGNHDITLKYIANKRSIELVEYVKIDDILICHGDNILKEAMKDSKIIIIGHEHPAVGLREKNKYESYKCFLKGKYERKTLIVIPSFNTLTTGTDVLRRRLLSPYLQQDLDNFEVYAIEDKKPYEMGKIKNLK